MHCLGAGPVCSRDDAVAQLGGGRRRTALAGLASGPFSVGACLRPALVRVSGCLPPDPNQAAGAGCPLGMARDSRPTDVGAPIHMPGGEFARRIKARVLATLTLR